MITLIRVKNIILRNRNFTLQKLCVNWPKTTDIRKGYIKRDPIQTSYLTNITGFVPVAYSPWILTQIIYFYTIFDQLSYCGKK